MKNIVLTVIMFAIAIALVVGVIVPLASHGRATGTNIESKYDGIEANRDSIAATIANH